MAIAGLAVNSIPGPTNISSKAYRWWVATDVPVNVTISNQWTDRIVSDPEWEMDLTRSPTNSSTGARYNDGSSTTSITTTNGTTFVVGSVGGATVGSAWFVVNADAANPSLSYIVSPFISDGHGIVVNGSNLQYGGDVSGGPNTICPIVTATNFDFGFVLTTTNTIWYTNGIVVRTNTVAGGPDSFTWGRIGSTFVSGHSFKGYFLEGLVYSNAYFFASNFTDLHKYATNLYHFQP